MAGPSDAAAKIPGVTELTRSDRTSQLLVARLDALASVAAQLHHADVERLVELASVATMHAVALETLHAEKAEQIWRDAHTAAPAAARRRDRAARNARGLASSTRRSRVPSCGRARRPAACARAAPARPFVLPRAFRTAPRRRATCTSTPIRSISAQGPIGQPAPFVIALSISSGATPASSSTRTQSFSSGMRMRLTMKPGVSLQRTGRLPACSAHV